MTEKKCDSLSDMLALAVNRKSFRCKNDFTSPRLGRIRCQLPIGFPPMRSQAQWPALPADIMGIIDFSALYVRKQFL